MKWFRPTSPLQHSPNPHPGGTDLRKRFVDGVVDTVKGMTVGDPRVRGLYLVCDAGPRAGLPAFP
jgi:hypothetical protein